MYLPKVILDDAIKKATLKWYEYLFALLYPVKRYKVLDVYPGFLNFIEFKLIKGRIYILKFKTVEHKSRRQQKSNNNIVIFDEFC